MIVLLIGCFFSCSTEKVKKEEGDGSYPQKWQLVKMTGSMINSVTTGKDMSWQEYYMFNADGTFLKSREQNGQVKVAIGTYSYPPNQSGEKSILITYQSGFELRASCFSDPPQESLTIISADKLVGTWNICDGPSLEYQLVGQVID
jgi:hypothetical protein